MKKALLAATKAGYRKGFDVFAVLGVFITLGLITWGAYSLTGYFAELTGRISAAATERGMSTIAQNNTDVILPLNNVEESFVVASSTEVVVASENDSSHESSEVSLGQYVIVTDSCSEHFEGDCLQARGGPGKSYESKAQLRTNMVLKVAGVIPTPEGLWYEVVFDEWLRYPDRLKGEWYVSADYVTPVQSYSAELTDSSATSSKYIQVDRSTQQLYAYDGEKLIFTMNVSTGRDGTPTPRGTFTVFKKTPSRYMQGPLPGISDDFYDLPGVPWNIYFTKQGAVIHGAYWHDEFGEQHSHGCVNLSPENAKIIYDWAEVGMKVTVSD